MQKATVPGFALLPVLSLTLCVFALALLLYFLASKGAIKHQTRLAKTLY